jgi:hypothetical protein
MTYLVAAGLLFTHWFVFKIGRLFERIDWVEKEINSLIVTPGVKTPRDAEGDQWLDEMDEQLWGKK